MKTIEFEAVFGDRKKTVRISQPSGAEGYQVAIENYYQGVLVLKAGKWFGYLNENSELTADDITALGEIIESKVNFSQ